MTGPLYFLPLGSLTRRRVEDAGLGYLFDGPAGPGPDSVETSAGPGGAAGSFFSVAGPHGRGAVAPHRAVEPGVTWSPIPGTAASVGLLPGVSPGPDDLARSAVVDGHEVELADGARWRVPVVRMIGGGTRLPRRIVWDGAAWRGGDVRPVYADLWAAGIRIWDWIDGDDKRGAVTFGEEATTAVAALSVNYRIGPAEVSALGLLDTANVVHVVRALIDLPALEGLLGKAGAASPS